MANDSLLELHKQLKAAIPKARDISFRQKQLQQLALLLKEQEEALCGAVYEDLKRPPSQTALEVTTAINDLSDIQKNLKKYLEPESKGTRWLLDYVREPAFAFDSQQVRLEPLGAVLIFGAWNFPIVLNLQPLFGAIAAGNTVLLKPSEQAPHTAQLLEALVTQYLDVDCYKVVVGGPEVGASLLELEWNHIFYTGGASTAHKIMEAAAKHLTPVTLELGGKSPAVIDKSCDLRKTARMIAWAKTFNCGQICVSVDYALCPQSLLMEFIEYVQCAWNEFYGEDVQHCSDYSRIVNTTHFDRLVGLLKNTQGQIVYGGKHMNRDDLFIEPSIVVVSSLDDCLMKEEIFGPILPIMPYESLEQMYHWIVNTPVLEQPLVLYIFSKDSLVDEQIMERITSGGVCINDVISHVMSSWLPFGGIGKSGMGVYHGKYSIQVFSHARAILKRNLKMEPLVGIRYPPTTTRKNWLLAMLTRQKI
ncbi:hypothetical protein GpartN1_g7828.t1 [Galdieria partita]|uniref:Aldehyde dehydrogenase n=1 Tax=Galdieria partita TaxID=83374 RepID=A0A9C7Q7R6_9RHOD|nr:hypothetical protein GpartN1_g7772.t1 [Galdieria partita]GJQ16037.1 hypothetical protein GpartN1_g7828.t1 [Galdieria partita]